LSLPVTQLLRTNNLEILFSHTRSEENSQAGTTGAIVQVMGFLSNLSGYQGPLSWAICPMSFSSLIVDTRQPALLAATAYFLGVVSLGQQPVFPQLASQSIQDF